MYWNQLAGDDNRLGNHDPLAVRTVAELGRLIIKRISDFHNVDCVVGVPRSGCVPASILALHLNVPLLQLEDFLDGRLSQSYTRRMSAKHKLLANPNSSPINVLIVDDATSNGVTFGDIRNRLSVSGIESQFAIEYLAAYCTPSGSGFVDYVLEELPMPRVFEWNMMHHANTRFFCVDLDGVLCDDPTIDENDDGPRYEHFCLNARPKVIPTARVGAIVTARIEKYRAHTEAWLAKHGVVYDRLIMCNLPSGLERRRLAAHAVMKADAYRTLGGMLFVESDLQQAQQIYTLTGKPVFWFGNGLVDKADAAHGVEVATLKADLARRNDTIEMILGSSSWRITAPLRAVGGGLRKILAR